MLRLTATRLSARLSASSVRSFSSGGGKADQVYDPLIAEEHKKRAEQTGKCFESLTIEKITACLKLSLG